MKTTRVSVIDEATEKSLGMHGALHGIGMCTCPCFDALMTVAKAMPERDAAMRLEGVLSVLSETPETVE